MARLNAPDRAAFPPVPAGGMIAPPAPDTAPGAMGPELELLLLCGRRELDPARRKRIQQLLKGGLDWESLVSLAHRHGMLTLLHFHIKATDPAGIPDAVSKELDHFAFKIVRRNLELTAALLELLDVFAAAGIPAIPFKGPPLASLIYGNLALRRFSDLDIALHRRDVSAAIELLVASHGFRAPGPLTDAQQEAHGRFHYARPLFSSDGTVKVDLHWGFAKDYFSAGIDSESLWGKTAPVSIQGHTFITFSPEVLLLVLCVHATKHGPMPWPRLNWICDIAELLRRSDLEWAQTLELARSSGTQRILRLGLSLARDLFDAPLPKDLSRQVQADRAAGDLAVQVRHYLLSEAPRPLGAWARIQFDLKSRERLREKTRYCLRRLLRPADRDWQLVHLPRQLTLLYIPLRILRLSIRYLLRPWKIADLRRRSEGPTRPD